MTRGRGQEACLRRGLGTSSDLDKVMEDEVCWGQDRAVGGTWSATRECRNRCSNVTRRCQLDKRFGFQEMETI